MKITIHLDLSPLQKRVIRTAVISGSVIGALGLGLAFAAPKHTFQANTSLSSTDMNDNFVDLDSRLALVEGRTIISKNGKKYSTNGTYCGKTSPTNGQITNGYAGAKTLCEAVAACGASPSAHMCSSEEVLRSVQMGTAVDVGWYSSAIFVNTTPFLNDCQSWTTTSNTSLAPGWKTTGTTAGIDDDGCGSQHPILCCD